MSYCRRSDDNYNCDVYAYRETSGYYVMHVAKERIIGDIPALDWSSNKTIYNSHKAQSEFLRTCRRAPIGLKFDGQTLQDYTLEYFHISMLSLKALGYRIPKQTFKNIEEELEGNNESD